MTNAQQSLNAKAPGLDLSNAGARDQLARRIKADIDAYCIRAYGDGFRSHLGASLLGRDCERELWYGFRWVFQAPLSGRQYRLFNRGHREEARFLEWLRGIGCQVWDIRKIELIYHPESCAYFWDEWREELANAGCAIVTDNPEHRAQALAEGIKEPPKGETQYRVSFCEGHGGGSLDGIVKLPEAYGAELAGVVILGEFKTSGTGRKFSDLVAKRVKVQKPEHFTQMCVYGKNYGFKYAVYLCINKNDDDLHIEIVELDWAEADRAEAKARRVIYAQEAPPKISQSPNYEKCMICDYAPVCHRGDPGLKNCRSCKNAAPIANKQWHCSHFNGVIPADFIPNGCDNWVSIL